ncbi:hypothetical protein HDU96_011148 [Phlyctochytrium bullatum]|nr:hypothetical protein HDU96_011148 [Phlyctochytrium bullatum]
MTTVLLMAMMASSSTTAMVNNNNHHHHLQKRQVSSTISTYDAPTAAELAAMPAPCRKLFPSATNTFATEADLVQCVDLFSLPSLRLDAYTSAKNNSDLAANLPWMEAANGLPAGGALDRLKAAPTNSDVDKSAKYARDIVIYLSELLNPKPLPSRFELSHKSPQGYGIIQPFALAARSGRGMVYVAGLSHQLAFPNQETYPDCDDFWKAKVTGGKVDDYIGWTVESINDKNPWDMAESLYDDRPKFGANGAFLHAEFDSNGKSFVPALGLLSGRAQVTLGTVTASTYFRKPVKYVLRNPNDGATTVTLTSPWLVYAVSEYSLKSSISVALDVPSPSPTPSASASTTVQRTTFLAATTTTATTTTTTSTSVPMTATLPLPIGVTLVSGTVTSTATFSVPSILTLVPNSALTEMLVQQASAIGFKDFTLFVDKPPVATELIPVAPLAESTTFAATATATAPPVLARRAASTTASSRAYQTISSQLKDVYPPADAAKQNVFLVDNTTLAVLLYHPQGSYYNPFTWDAASEDVASYLAYWNAMDAAIVSFIKSNPSIKNLILDVTNWNLDEEVYAILQYFFGSSFKPLEYAFRLTPYVEALLATYDAVRGDYIDYADIWNVYNTSEHASPTLFGSPLTAPPSPKLDIVSQAQTITVNGATLRVSGRFLRANRLALATHLAKTSLTGLPTLGAQGKPYFEPSNVVLVSPGCYGGCDEFVKITRDQFRVRTVSYGLMPNGVPAPPNANAFDAAGGASLVSLVSAPVFRDYSLALTNGSMPPALAPLAAALPQGFNPRLAARASKASLFLNPVLVYEPGAAVGATPLGMANATDAEVTLRDLCDADWPMRVWRVAVNPPASVVVRGAGKSGAVRGRGWTGVAVVVAAVIAVLVA